MNGFKLKQNSLEVIQTIIKNNKGIISVRLISHKVEKTGDNYTKMNKKRFAI